MKVNQLMLSCACVLMLALPLVPDLANAQSDRAPVTQPVAAGLPVINDVNPVAGTGAEVNKAGEPTENHYGLESLWRTSDAVARTVLLLLLIMSAGSWYILVVKVLEQSKMMRQAKAAAKDFWSAGTVEQGAAALEAGSP
ncbi:MAG TPA: MotA/TolQ/ExbB proton channel family protein, partial [Rhodoferax sp.]|nr:MotA/TolQ/ExbB proton channel family protein [Rhodoferax sp.]